MTELIPSRRGFLTGMASLFAAPSIIRADSLMKIKPLPFEPYMVVMGKHYDGTTTIVRKIFEDPSKPDAFLSLDFLNRYERTVLGLRDISTAVVTNTREEGKALRWVEAPKPQAFRLEHTPEPTRFLLEKESFGIRAVNQWDPLFHATKEQVEASGYWQAAG